MHLRSLVVEDASALAHLSAQLGYPSTIDAIARRLHALGDATRHGLFGAVDDELGLCGWAHVEGRHVIELDPYAELCALVVDERRRSQGIGRRLVTAAEQWAAQRGYATMFVFSNVVRARAHRFYEALGYEHTKTSALFEKRLAQASFTG